MILWVGLPLRSPGLRNLRENPQQLGERGAAFGFLEKKSRGGRLSSDSLRHGFWNLPAGPGARRGLHRRRRTGLAVARARAAGQCAPRVKCTSGHRRPDQMARAANTSHTWLFKFQLSPIKYIRKYSFQPHQPLFKSAVPGVAGILEGAGGQPCPSSE